MGKADGCTCGGVETDTGYGDIHTTDCILSDMKEAIFLSEVERRAGATREEIEQFWTRYVKPLSGQHWPVCAAPRLGGELCSCPLRVVVWLRRILAGKP